MTVKICVCETNFNACVAFLGFEFETHRTSIDDGTEKWARAANYFPSRRTPSPFHIWQSFQLENKDIMPSKFISLPCLPIELLDDILSYLSLTHLFLLSCTSSELYKLVKYSDKIWRAAYFSRWKSFIIRQESLPMSVIGGSKKNPKIRDQSLSLRWKAAYHLRADFERDLARGLCKLGIQTHGTSSLVTLSCISWQY